MLLNLIKLGKYVPNIPNMYQQNSKFMTDTIKCSHIVTTNSSKTLHDTTPQRSIATERKLSSTFLTGPFEIKIVALPYRCLFVWSLSSHSIIFQSYGDVTIAGEGLQILTYARHSWPLSSEDSLTCHIYCDTLYNGHLRGPVTLTPVAERLAVELLLTVFTSEVCRDRRSNLYLPHATRTLYL